MLAPILLLAATLPFAQHWSDTGLISRDDDWAGVPGVVGHRGDGLTSVAGTDPRVVRAEGSGTPLDVNANEVDPLAVGLSAGVTEFELPDPVVALQGSATAAAPHLVLSLDTRGRSGVMVRYRLRDVDASSIANAVQPVALQYRVGGDGDFAAVAGGFVADATAGPGQSTLVTPVSATLPAAADDKPLVQLRILTTNALGQDEWVGVDDLEVEAGGQACGPPGPAPGTGSSPQPPPLPPAGPPQAEPSLPPRPLPPALTGLTISPAGFAAAKRGPAIARTGRAGASLRFRLSRPAKVEFAITGPRPLERPAAGRRSGEIGRVSIRGRRGPNRLRLTGRLRGRALPAGPYRLTARAIDRGGLASPNATVGFRIR
jgi:hypothetical protein